MKRISVVGGGPGGLYFAYMWKSRHPQDSVTVFEQNARDATFGFGVSSFSFSIFSFRRLVLVLSASDGDGNGLAVFEHLRRKPSGRHVFLFAFDLLELDGEDLRRAAFETRKATLASPLRGSLPGLRLNEHLTHPGEVVFRHACKTGLEGIVSKRLGSCYRSARSPDWLKFKNPDAPAVKRERKRTGADVGLHKANIVRAS